MLFHKKPRSNSPAAQDPGRRPLSPPVASPVAERDYMLYIHGICPTQHVAAGEIIVDHQTSIDTFYIITRGALELSASFHGVSRCIEISEGESFGHILAPDNADITYTVRATISTAVITISSRTFEHLPSHIQQNLYENLYRKSMAIISDLIRQFHHAISKSTHLTIYLENEYTRNKNIISSDIFQSIIKKIPRLPTYATNILNKLMDDNISAQEVANTIQSDPSMTSIILKNVNSPYYGLRQKISNVHHAILYLGFNNVYQFIVNHAMKNIISDNEDFAKIQIHSTLISILAYEIALLSKKSVPTTMTTTGLLHDIGKMVLVLLKQKNPAMRELFDLVDAAAIGASLLQSWELPERIFEVIQHQRLPEFCPPASLPEPYGEDIAILYVAHICHDRLLDTDSASTVFFEDYLARLDLPSSNPAQFYDDVMLPILWKNQKKLPETIRSLLQSSRRPAPLQP